MKKIYGYCIILFLHSPFVNAQNGDTTYASIEVKNGTSLFGKIIEEKNEELTLNDFTLGKITISKKNIEAIVRNSSTQSYLFTTLQDKKIIGNIKSIDEKEIVVKTQDLLIFHLEKQNIKSIRSMSSQHIKRGEYIFLNPIYSRYLFGPSAIPLKKGSGYYQNTMILFNNFHIGITDNVSLGVGTVFPIFGYLSPQVRFSLGKNFYIGASGFFGYGIFITREQPNFIGMGHALVTYGNYENNVTFGVGWGKGEFNNAENNQDNDWDISVRPQFYVAGMVRTGKRTSLVTENWIGGYRYIGQNSGLYRYRNAFVSSLIVRILWEKHSMDLGLSFIPFSNFIFGGRNYLYGIIFPYIGYGYKFSKR